MKKLSSFVLALFLLVTVAAPTYAQVVKPSPIVDSKPLPVPIDERPTDTAVLKALSDSNIDVAYVKKVESDSFYSEKYVSILGDDTVEVFSQTPIRNADGDTIDVGFFLDGGSCVSKTNTFKATITGTTVSVSVKDGDSMTWNPSLYVGSTRHYPASPYPAIYTVDPYNSNYRNNVLEWDYGVCKRQFRIIEGMVREWWIFDSEPSGEVRIQHNLSGDLSLNLGQAVDANGFPVDCYTLGGDVEVVPSMSNAVFPVMVGGSATFYPDANPETTSVDGWCGEYDYYGKSWTTIRNSGGDSADPTTNYGNAAYLMSKSSISFTNMGRGLFLFDTSSLPDGATKTAATFSLYGSVKHDDYAGWNPELGVVSAAPASNTNLVSGDYDSLGTTRYATDKTYASFNTAAYNDWTLNASGLAAISLTGVTKFGTRFGRDIDNTPVSAEAAGRYAIFQVWMAEKGAGFQPKLVVTYTSPPEVETLAASGVLSTSATLNGNITNVATGNATERGFDYGLTVAYGTSITGHGDWGVGAFANSTGAVLAPGTTYHFRAKAYNADGWGYGLDNTFTTSIIAPTVTTQAATYVSVDGARVNSQLDNDGGEACSMRFQYYPPGGNWGTSTATSWDAGYMSGQTHYEDLTGLTGNTTYTFRAQANNGNGTANGTALTFTTAFAVGDPSSLRIYVATDEPALVLSWTKGAGSTDSIVRYQEGAYPSGITDGLSGGYPTTGSAKLSGLSTGTTYYVRIWGRSGNETSTGYTQAMATTYGVPATSDLDAPETPALWFISTDYMRFSNLPLYAQLNSFFDSLSIPRGTGWFLGAILLCAALSLAVLAKSKDGAAAMIVLALSLLICVVLQLLPLWMGAFVALAIVAASKVLSNRRQGGSYA